MSLRMPRQNRRELFVVFIVLLLIFETAAYIATTPRPTEQFFQLYVLGANHLTTDYYPNGNPNIRLRDSVRWYLGAANSMGNVQLIAIRVKLGNQSINPPNTQQSLPSPAPVICEFTRFLANNETWEIPVVWQITNASTVGGSTRILQMHINNSTYTLQDVSARNGYNFRVIIELYSWDDQAGSFQFGWFAGTEHRTAWLQVWFNVTSTQPP